MEVLIMLERDKSESDWIKAQIDKIHINYNRL